MQCCIVQVVPELRYSRTFAKQGWKGGRGVGGGDSHKATDQIIAALLGAFYARNKINYWKRRTQTPQSMYTWIRSSYMHLPWIVSTQLAMSFVVYSHCRPQTPPRSTAAIFNQCFEPTWVRSQVGSGRQFSTAIVSPWNTWGLSLAC